MKHISQFLAAFAAAVLVAGCLSAVPYTPVSRYSISPDIDPQPREQEAGVIAVRQLEAAQPYTDSMVFRPDEFTVSYRAAEEWAESPRDSVTRAVIDALGQTNFFSDVGTTSDVPLPEYILTGQLRRFDEMRTTTPPEALCEIRIDVRENKRPARQVISRTYRESVPLNGESGAAFAEAMTSAVERIVANATEDIVTAIQESPVEQ